MKRSVIRAADVEDIESDLGSYQSGGGTAGYSPAGNVASANAIPGGRGLLGNGGDGGTSQSAVMNTTSGNISAGAGGSATNNGCGEVS